MRNIATYLLLTFLLIGGSVNAQVWKNPNEKVDKRVKDLLSKMTLEEKISYCGSKIPAIDRLGIPAYEWYGEALHGIIAWNCTQFPQNIAMGCTWNPDLMFDVATAISNEVRVLKNTGQKEVMMFSPTVNMARDPRWGRNGECYSEDPFLMSQIARMYVRGMQGNDPNYIKAVTTVKHYVANNVDFHREYIHSMINEKDLYEYYFPAYKACVADEEAAGIMTALNGLNGIPCSAHKWLVNDVLRDEWGFKGYVIADWAAVQGVEKNMKYAKSQPEAAQMAIRAGVDQECFRNEKRQAPMVYALKEAVEQGLLEEKEIDVSVGRLLRLRFMTGDFDDPTLNPYSNIPKSVMECDAHKKLALKAAEQAIVLLKNDNILPLKKNPNSIGVIGPFANRCWMGIYSGFPKSKISPLEGIKNATNAKVAYAEGCSVTGDDLDTEKIASAVELAKKMEYVVLMVGNDETTSTENLDRKSLKLPGNQHQLIESVYAVNKNVILVLVPSGPTAVTWEEKNLPGIVCMWPNGQEQGTALANVLFGKVNPSGKLNSTWYTSDNELTDLHDYNIQNNRTYMYYKGKPLYPFGFGLNYTSFDISNLSFDKKGLKHLEAVTVSVQVKNTGKMNGDEIVQLYIRDLKSSEATPKKALKGFQRIHVKAGQLQTVQITVPYEAFGHYNTEKKQFEVEAGQFEIMVGNSSENILTKKKIKVAGGAIPPVNINNKSAWFDPNDPNRSKGWQDIYEDKSFLKAQSNVKKEEAGISFKTSFSDPGYYVNTWDAVVNFKLKSSDATFKLTMLSNEIGNYKVTKGNSEVSTLSVKIPIPPEYGKEVTLKAISLKGDIEIKSITIIPPGGKKSYEIYPEGSVQK